MKKAAAMNRMQMSMHCCCMVSCMLKSDVFSDFKKGLYAA